MKMKTNVESLRKYQERRNKEVKNKWNKEKKMK